MKCLSTMFILFSCCLLIFSPINHKAIASDDGELRSFDIDDLDLDYDGIDPDARDIEDLSEGDYNPSDYYKEGSAVCSMADTDEECALKERLADCDDGSCSEDVPEVDDFDQTAIDLILKYQKLLRD